MLTETATGTLIGNHRVLAFFQAHGPPLDRAAFIAAAAQQVFKPGKTFFPVKLGKPHPYLFNGYVMERVGRTDGGTAHTEMAGRLLGIDLRGPGHKEIKSTPHLNAVKDADLRTLAALKTAGKKFLFASCSGGTEKMCF